MVSVSTARRSPGERAAERFADQPRRRLAIRHPATPVGRRVAAALRAESITIQQDSQRTADDERARILATDVAANPNPIRALGSIPHLTRLSDSRRHADGRRATRQLTAH